MAETPKTLGTKELEALKLLCKVGIGKEDSHNRFVALTGLYANVSEIFDQVPSQESSFKDEAARVRAVARTLQGMLDETKFPNSVNPESVTGDNHAEKYQNISDAAKILRSALQRDFPVTLDTKELEALNLLRNIKLLGKSDRGNRDTFIALTGLYTNAAEMPNQAPNPTLRCFKDDAACVKTTTFGLQNILNETQKKDSINPQSVPGRDHEEMYGNIFAAVKVLRDALRRDFPMEHGPASALLVRREQDRAWSAAR